MLSVNVGLDTTTLYSDVGEWVQLTEDSIHKWNRRLQSIYREEFGKNTQEPGLRTISTFAGTRIEKTNNGEILHLFADAKLSRRSTKKTESDKWNGILHMAEHGRTRPTKGSRSGRKTITPTGGTLLAIPVNGTPRDKSPYQYAGTWIKSNKKNVWLFIQKQPKPGEKKTIRHPNREARLRKEKPRLPKNADRLKKEVARRKNKWRSSRVKSGLNRNYKVLFIGKKVVQVRKGKGFYTKTIDHIFGDKPKFIKSFLRIDKVGTTVNIDSRAGKLLRSYFPRPKD